MQTRKWDTPEYQQISSARAEKGNLFIEFQDGSSFVVPQEHLLPFDSSNAFWNDIRYTPFEIIVPTSVGEKEITWTTIRLLTDPDFAAHWANIAESEASHIGKRIRRLRKSRNLSSKEVAERAGITPQSLSRIENGHHDVVFTTLKKILAAMGYSLTDLPEELFESPSIEDLSKRLEKIGLSKEVYYKRLVPDYLISTIRSGSDNKEATESFIQTLAKIFMWSPDDIFIQKSLSLQTSLIGNPKFKTSKKYVEKQTVAYTFYAHYLSLLVLNANTINQKHDIPSDVNGIRRKIESFYGGVNFETLLNYVWDLGIPVLPLSDPGAFHGACWKVSGHPVIVLKQVTSSQGRWLFDLAHEMGHVVKHLSNHQTSVIEGEEITPFDESLEESEANDFAAEILLFGKQEELAEKCVAVAKGKVEYLKSAVIQVSSDERVPVDLLANYLAFRLSLTNGINWWGTANNLQITEPSPIRIAKEVMLKRVNLNVLNSEDRSILLKAVSN